ILHRRSSLPRRDRRPPSGQGTRTRLERLGSSHPRAIAGMQIILNGTSTETAAAHVEALVAEVGLKRGMVLVEHNSVALHPDEWPAVTLKEQDRLELLRIVAGG